MAQTNTQANGIEKRFAKMNQNVSKSFDFGSSLGTAGKIAGGVLSAGAAKEFLDSATKIDNALKVAGLSGNELNAVYEKLYQSAQKNGAPLVALADLYGKVSLSQKELGVGSLELAKFSDNVALALRVSGKTAAESSGALLQLSQALGAGTVRAEEFNSILEGAPSIVQAAANGIEEAGGSVAKLRKMVNDGEISSKAFFLGFQAGADGLRSKAASMEMTISQAFTNLKNAAINAAREVDQVSKISGDAVNGVNNLALAVDRLVVAYKMLAEFVGNSDVGKGVASLGTAADDLWKNPSWRNLVKFLEPGAEKLLFGTVEDRSVQARIDGVQKLAKEMKDAEALRQEGVNKLKNAGKTEGPSRFDEAFAPFTPKKIKASDYPAEKKKKDGEESTDVFERASAQIEKRTAVLNAETAAIDLGAAAQQRARVQTELETAAKRANEAAGLKNTEVTDAQRAKITELADAYLKAAEAAAQANSPLNTFARQARDTDALTQQFAVGGLRTLEDGLTDIVTGATSAKDAFKNMANAIIADLARIAVRRAITGPIAGALGGVLGGGGGASSSGGFSLTGTGGLFASGGYTGPGGKNQPAGVVHKGEYVFDQQSVNRIGLGNLAKLHRGYADGGPVGMRIPSSIAGRSGSGTNVTVEGASIVVQGNADEKTLALMQREFAKRDAELGGKVISHVRQAKSSRVL
jgi:lambda family phage tail tape measure protein